ncbi:MAG: transcription antitermination factor NusB [Pyrinomonadaceae bacterium]
MSFDKSGKNTGSRRKARECSLQMLFAADVVGEDGFSISGYWAELGFDEVHKGAGALALEFRDEVEKLAGISEALRSWIKKADPTEKVRKRSDWARGLTASIEALRRSFIDLVRDLVNAPGAPDDALKGPAEKVRLEFESLVSELHSRFSSVSHLTSEERSPFAELRSQGDQTLTRLTDHLIPEFCKLIAAAGAARPFADKLVRGTRDNLSTIDDRIRTRAEHWRIERMAIVDRNVLRLAVYEFLYEDTPHTVVINEGLEIARRFSTFEATQFINGILDAIRLDLEKEAGPEGSKIKSQTSSK